MKKATEIRKLDGFAGDARLYKLSKPISAYDFISEEITSHEYVVVFAAVVPSTGPETCIFPANAEGEIVSCMELEGSAGGTLEHARALANAGYAID